MLAYLFEDTTLHYTTLPTSYVASTPLATSTTLGPTAQCDAGFAVPGRQESIQVCPPP